MSIQTILVAFGLTMIAGLATGLGGALAFFTKQTNQKFLSAALGFSAGVMIYISFMEMMPESLHLLSQQYAEKTSMFYLLLAFFAGIAMIMLIDFLVPSDENPHEMHLPSDINGENPQLKRTGLMIALVLAIHNFPEGLATFTSALENMDIAIPIVVAIAIHNIPEGIAVSVPIYHATGNRKKAFLFSFLSGMAEPLGALVGFLILLPFWSPLINALLLAFVSGIMVFISFDELLPGAERYGHHHYGIGGVVAGMVLMAFSLLLFM